MTRLFKKNWKPIVGRLERSDFYFSVVATILLFGLFFGLFELYWLMVK